MCSVLNRVRAINIVKNLTNVKEAQKKLQNSHLVKRAKLCVEHLLDVIQLTISSGVKKLAQVFVRFAQRHFNNGRFKNRLYGEILS